MQDEDSNVAEHRERDLMIARGGSESEASESSEDSIGNEEREKCIVDWYTGIVNGVECIVRYITNFTLLNINKFTLGKEIMR
ncbi:hypothetical protein Syun_018746 [Stephania yunnanensis]|uniref:Uncharacterized protein n=1 Tax=Stephania yunnanensis TaxID=152371 RepID=A0AAP0ISZ6_9MAGN